VAVDGWNGGGVSVSSILLWRFSPCFLPLTPVTLVLPGSIQAPGPP